MYKGETSVFHHHPLRAQSLTEKDIEDYLFNMEHIGEMVEKMEPTLTITGRSKQQGVKGTAQGEKFDSKWEYIYYLYVKEVRGEYIRRNHEEWVPYYDENGKERKFYPDFCINGGYAEVKGRFRPSDLCKMEQHPEILFISADDMKEIRKEVYKKCPKWESDYIAIA